jgi:hypothetical protein
MSHGAPLTFAAGGTHTGWIARMRAGEDLTPALGAFRAGVAMSTYPASVVFEQPLWPI